MQHNTAIASVQAWQDAVNRGDREQLVQLSDPNIELVGPRGSAYGVPMLLQWLDRAGLTLQTQRIFARGNTVVAAQHGVWRSSPSGDVIGEADVASQFHVENGQISRYARYDSLGAALDAAGLSEADQVAGADTPFHAP